MKNGSIIKLFMLLFLITITIGACEEETKKDTIPEEDIQNKSVFSVPFENIQINTTLYKISTAKDTVLTYRTGSRIVIPKNAFLDKDGKTVKGDVKLSYREFNNAMEVYVAGIPMAYDSAGVEAVFETAGMLEINAESQGHSVFVNPAIKIEIQMSSFQPGTEYNLYQLDPAKGEWTYTGKDKVEVENSDKFLASLPNVPPVPKKATDNSFSIGDNTGKYPELNIYKNVLFEPVNNQSCGFSGTDIKVKDIGKGMYEVIFIFDAYGVHREEKCKCYLAFKPGVDYDNAISTYQTKYKKQIEKRDKMKAEYEMKMKNYNDVRKVYSDLGLLDLFYKKEVSALSGEEKIVRVFQINGFGIWNTDCPMSYPQGAALTAKYQDKSGKSIQLGNVVLVEKERNAIFQITDLIRFNPQKENLLFGVTPDGKLAYIKPDEFKKIKQTKGNYTFVMDVYPEKLKTYEEICRVLF
jgi:hypothetical protein